ncbi:Rab GDP dissociation inhibitor [Cryptosporidium felis]|nr:Rab GDP dissociation inhibitor [Cryptosporidium felis]
MKSTGGKANEDTWDVLIIGTGVIESVIASGLSLRGYSVLVIDSNATYGGIMNTVKFPAIHDWLSDSPKHISPCFEVSSFSEKELDPIAYTSLSEAELEGLSRIYIDLVPKVLFSRGNLVNLIISCGISGYLDFQGIEDVFYAEKAEQGSATLTRTPYSKKDIFASSDLGLVEKRQIMRLFGGISDVLEISKIENKMDLDFVSDPFRTPAYISNAQNRPTPRRPELSSFSDFQDHWRLSDRVMDLVRYNVVFNSHYQNDLYDWERDFVKYFSLLISSLNQHGCIGTPFLYPNYGTCDLAQSFSRLAAVKGSTQRLGTSISRVSRQEDNSWEVYLEPGNSNLEKTRCKLLLGSLNSVSTHFERDLRRIDLVENKVLCCFLILTQPLVSYKHKDGKASKKGLSITSMKTTANQSESVDSNIDIVYLFQCDYSTGCCPPGYYILYANKLLANHETPEMARKQVEEVVNSFLQGKSGDETKILYKGSYVYNQRLERPQLLENGVILLPDPSINNNSFFLIDRDIENAFKTIGESLSFLSSEKTENITSENFSKKGGENIEETPPIRDSNAFIIKKLQNILD